MGNGLFDAELTGLEHLLLAGRRLRLPAAEARVRAACLLVELGLGEIAEQPVRTYSADLRGRLDLACDRLGRPDVAAVAAAQTLDVRPADPADLDTVSMVLADVVGAEPAVYGNDGGLVSVPLGDLEMLPSVVARLCDWDVRVAELAVRDTPGGSVVV